MKTFPTSPHGASEQFVARHAAAITGILHCWDRLRFTGTLRTLQSVYGMHGYLQRAGVLLKDFKAFVSDLTERVRAQTHALAETAGRQVHYLHSSLVRKEQLARERAQREGISEGLIGIWSCVEPCQTFFVSRDRQRKELYLEFAPGKCLHHYFYFQDAQCGLVHLRLQTWFPYNVSVCLNGHHWLARQLRAAGIGYRQEENCFTWIEDMAAAQQLAGEQLKTDWASSLQKLLLRCHPLAEEICRPIGQSYYWSAQETEFSTDVLFCSVRQLAALYPRLIEYGISHFGSRDVLRFLGRWVPAQGIGGNFQAEIKSSLKRRAEGMRIKHTAAGNSVKLYDKEARVLRVETTINQTEGYRVYRQGAAACAPAPGPTPGKSAPQNPPAADGSAQAPAHRPGRWMRMRKGVADMYRRAEVSRAANERYLQALAVVESERAVGEISDTIFRPVMRKGRRFRALNPWTEKDARLLEAVSSGDWIPNGFRNCDVRALLHGHSTDPAQERKNAARISRALALLRAHGLIKKMTPTHRYHLTSRGREIITALQAARKSTIQTLLKAA